MTEKVDNALNESRILVLVAQVLLGFQYEAVFEPGFAKLPAFSQYLTLAGLALMLIAVALLISPAAYNRIVTQGHVNKTCLPFITRVSETALLPFAVGLGLEAYIVCAKVAGTTFGIVCGVLLSLAALFFWYGLEAWQRRQEGAQTRQKSPFDGKEMAQEETPLKDRIKFVLTEARVVLPGAQALLGFQFIVVLMTRFETLSGTLKYIHLASLAAVAVSTILLMAPAAYHRIVERGEDTERLHAFASYMIIAAMAFLALGLSGDVLVVVSVVLHSLTWAMSAAAITLLGFYGLWFGYMLYRRAEIQSHARSAFPAGSQRT